ncbi:MAG: PA14 domain-containing protein [Planctomycetota bacterium]
MTLPDDAGVVSVAVCLLISSMAIGAEKTPPEVLEARFGEQIRRALKTPDRRDEVELAGKLIEAVGETTDRDLKRLLCEKARELASRHPEGLPAAITATKLLAEVAPRRQAECRRQVIELRKRQYTASRGEERKRVGRRLIADLLTQAERHAKAGKVDEALDLAAHAERLAGLHGAPQPQRLRRLRERLQWRRKVADRVRACRRRLEEDEWDAEARQELVDLLVVACDRPKEAMEYVTPDFDMAYTELLPLAAKRVRSVPTADCLLLGRWYRRLCEDADRWTKIEGLERAGQYYRRFLATYEHVDDKRKEAEAALRKLMVELASLRRGNPDIPKNLVAGINATYYALKEDPRRVPDFSGLKPYKRRTPNRLHHDTGKDDKTIHFPKPPEDRCLGGKFEAYIEVPSDGVYDFWLNSDDGSRLYVDGELVVDNDGRHSPRLKHGRIALTVGKHAFRVVWFDHGGYGRLEAFWKGPLIRKKELIPPEAYYRTPRKAD